MRYFVSGGEVTLDWASRGFLTCAAAKLSAEMASAWSHRARLGDAYRQDWRSPGRVSRSAGCRMSLTNQEAEMFLHGLNEVKCGIPTRSLLAWLAWIGQEAGAGRAQEQLASLRG